ncbi:MAG TPA: hypothetical protein VGV12_12600 [Gemmatimonadales bacterium]|nr:hypothetical protein [Gemmatimonadales bacterium]
MSQHLAHANGLAAQAQQMTEVLLVQPIARCQLGQRVGGRIDPSDFAIPPSEMVRPVGLK